MAGGGRIVPVILSGGAGTRLWPLSRELYPEAAPAAPSATQPAAGDGRRGPTPGVRGAAHRRATTSTASSSPSSCAQLGDHAAARSCWSRSARNTAPGRRRGRAACRSRDDPDALMLVLPSDHVIAGRGRLPRGRRRPPLPRRAPGGSSPSASRPTTPRPATATSSAARRSTARRRCSRSSASSRSPTAPTAEGYLAAGELSRGTAASSCSGASASSPSSSATRRRCSPPRARRVGRREPRSRLPPPRPRTPSRARPAISIDYAVMEKTDKAAVVPVDLRLERRRLVGRAVGHRHEGRRTATCSIGDVDRRARRSNSYLRAERPAGRGARRRGPGRRRPPPTPCWSPRKDRAQDVKDDGRAAQGDGPQRAAGTPRRATGPGAATRSIDHGDRATRSSASW